jgi:cardiolipin synthase A/B
MTNFIAGNQIKLLRGGAEYFPALEAAIENAMHEIYLQSYIFEVDKAGISIASALKKAAQRGVAVKVLLDGFGCKDMPKTYLQELTQAGVQVLFYRPKISPWTLRKNRLRRLHRKIVVVDGTVAFVGGINIIDDYNVPNNTPPRIDYAVRVEGALLPSILFSVDKLWHRMSWLPLQRTKFSAAKAKPAKLNHIVKDGIDAAFLLRDNILHRRDIEEAYLSAINHAQSEIIIANAYFVPGRRFRQALLAAAKRGVKVELLLQGRMEYFLMSATHAFYSKFLRSGIEIFEYRKSFMHCKVAVIDGCWATVGSSNIDPFSMLLACEANIVVQDTVFTSELRTEIISSIRAGAYQVTGQGWVHGNMMKRFSSWVVYELVRLSLGIIGYSNEQ